jgi:hypothetical protein
MAKPLVLKFGDAEIPCQLSRVERSDLYGFVDTEALDEKGRRCSLATLADDGRSVIASGGTALVTLSPDGNWLDKKQCVPTDAVGQRITPVASSYSAPVPLEKTATVDEYLSHDIRSVYQIGAETDLSPLMAELKKGTIYTFPYSFRGGLEADQAFLLLAADGTPFIAIGCPTKLEFVGLEQTATLAEEDDGEGEDAIDFAMM